MLADSNKQPLACGDSRHCCQTFSLACFPCPLSPQISLFDLQRLTRQSPLNALPTNSFLVSQKSDPRAVPYKYTPFPLLLSSMTLCPSFLNATCLVACPLLPSCLWFSKCNIFAICIRVTQRAGYNAWPHSRPTDSGWGPWGVEPANAPAYYQGPQGIPRCTKSENATLCLLLCFAETERKFPCRLFLCLQSQKLSFP